MKEKITAILQNACALPEEISQESELKTLSLDSLSFVGAIVELEREYDIEFEPDELAVSEWITAGDVIRAVEEKCKKKF
ncbi:MAG: acyl carrier protein [Clostridia bacterium]|jgi:acyl carrier protein|nr:acyl carrier protein [Clostridia bacterium]